jgi:hypothetical protein
VTREARGITASQFSWSVGVTPAQYGFGISPGNPSEGIREQLFLIFKA